MNELILTCTTNAETDTIIILILQIVMKKLGQRHRDIKQLA